MRIAMWQGSFPETIDSAIDEIEATVACFKSDLYVFPELYLGGYLLQNVRPAQPLQLERIHQISAEQDVAIVFGYVEHDGTHNYNSAMCVDKGRIVATYRKTHLFGSNEKAAFLPGEHLCAPFEIRGVTAALLICYDLEFPEAARSLTLRGAQLLLVPTANMTPYNLVNDIMVPVRALENHCTVCYCNWGDFTSAENVTFNGRSSIVGPSGTPMAKFIPGEIGVKVANVALGDAHGEDDYITDRRPNLYVLN